MKCPICGKPTEWKDNSTRPFCSERCKLLDFGAWANEEYAVPAEEIAPSLEEVEQVRPALPDNSSGGANS